MAVAAAVAVVSSGCSHVAVVVVKVVVAIASSQRVIYLAFYLQPAPTACKSDMC